MDNEDLTASHWDDVITPNTKVHEPTSFDAEFNGFSDLTINKDTANESESEPEPEPHESQESPNYNYSYSLKGSAYDTAKSELDQLHQIKKDQRDIHKSQLINELTKNDTLDDQLEASITSPSKIDSHDTLFKDIGSPIKIDIDENQVQSKKETKKTGKKLLKRPRKYSSQKIIQHLTDTSINKDQIDPLQLNDEARDDDDALKSNPKTDLVRESEAPLYNIKSEQQPMEEKNDHKPNLPPTSRTNIKPFLEISVSDPFKVGDITNAHIIYTITTKVRDLSDLEEHQQLQTILTKNEYVVTRRFKDFRWIYHQLQNNHLGRIIPPPPSKQTYIGRFNESLIENRRLSLEKMLAKISSISNLSKDEDFLMFLTTDDFINDSKERERISGSGASLQNNETSENDNIFDVNVDTSSSSGFMSSIFSMSNKVDEPDEFFDKKRHYIETLEINLKNFYRSIESIINQRVDLVNVIEQMITALEELATVEISKQTTDLLLAFSDLQVKVKDNLDRINLQDHLTLGFTIEEYLRIIGSIKYVLDQRLKIYQTYQNYASDLSKKKSALNKQRLKNAVDKVNQLSFEVDKLSSRTTSFEKKFHNISDIIKQELDKFEMEKIDDFRNSVEIFIESSIESQKESIELWETFYERQNLSQY